MGDYRLEVKGVGGHGCDRAAAESAVIRYETDPEHLRWCTDCLFRNFVERLCLVPGTVREATLTHWPGTVDEVIDDVLGGRRASGGFR